MSTIKVLNVVIAIPLVFGGCSFMKSQSTAKVSIKLPEKKTGFGAKLLRSRSANINTTNSAWGLANPTTIEENDCYAVFVQASDLESGSCTTADGQAQLPISRLLGLYSAGKTIALEIPSGSNRTLGVFSFTSGDGSCTNALDAQFAPQNYSQPMLIGSKTQNLSAGANEVIIDISMKKSLAIESCQGKAFASLVDSHWPSCPIKVAGVHYGNGELAISGQCLSNTSQVTLVNTKTSEKFPMTLQSKNSRELRLTPTSTKVGLLANTLYRVLVTDAFGQMAEVPFNLSLENVMTFPYLKDAKGAVIGDLLPMGGSMGGGNYFNLLFPSGELQNYFSPAGYYSTARLHLVPGFYTISSTLTMPPKQLALNGLMPWISNYIQFSDTDCTGDVIFPFYNYNQLTKLDLRGNNVVVQPEGCKVISNDPTYGDEWSCSSWKYFRLQGPPEFKTAITAKSTLQMSWGKTAANGTFAYCYNFSGATSPQPSYVFTASQKVDFGPNDPPTVIENAVLVGR